MQRPHTSILLSITALAVGSAAWLLLAPSPVSRDITTTQKEPDTSHPLPRPEPDWNKLTEKELRDYEASFQKRGNEGAPWTGEVPSGQSIVTSCYESRPGVFVFSKLTPCVMEDGRVEIRNHIFDVDVSGGGRTIFNQTVKATPGKKVFWGTGAPEGGAYLSWVMARVGDDGTTLHLESAGSHTPLKSKPTQR